MLQSLVSFEFGEVMWCDVLYENIGIRNIENFTSVKLTDLDEVFFVRKVFENVSVESDKKCNENTDCLGENYDIGLYYHRECSPYCQTNGYCSLRPQRSNLAHLCDTLFADVIFNPVVRKLSDQQISASLASEIYWIFKDCAKSAMQFETTGDYLASIRTVRDKLGNVTRTV